MTKKKVADDEVETVSAEEAAAKSKVKKAAKPKTAKVEKPKSEPKPEPEPEVETEPEEIENEPEEVEDDVQADLSVEEASDESFVGKYISMKARYGNKIMNLIIEFVEILSGKGWTIDTIVRVFGGWQGYGLTFGPKIWNARRVAAAFQPLVGDVAEKAGRLQFHEIRAFLGALREFAWLLQGADRIAWKARGELLFPDNASLASEAGISIGGTIYRAFRETDPEEGGPCVSLGVSKGKSVEFVPTKIVEDAPAILALLDWVVEVVAAQTAAARVVTMSETKVKTGQLSGFTMYEDTTGRIFVKLGARIEIREDHGNGLIVPVYDEVNEESFTSCQEVVRSYLAARYEEDLRPKAKVDKPQQ